MKHRIIHTLILTFLSLSLQLPSFAQQPPAKPEAKPTIFELSPEGKKTWEALLKDDQAAQQLERDIAQAQERLKLLKENLQLKFKLLQADEQAKTCGDCVLTGEGRLVKPAPPVPAEPKKQPLQPLQP